MDFMNQTNQMDHTHPMSPCMPHSPSADQKEECSWQTPGMAYVPWQNFTKVYDPKMNRAGSMQPMNQKELYEWIATLGFCAVDMMLYLDTHPDDEAALDYFNQCTQLYRNAKMAYEKQYGPLNAFGESNADEWNWNEGPMPWEGGR